MIQLEYRTFPALLSWELISISTRLVFISHGFFLSRSISFPEVYELLAPVPIYAQQIIPSTLIGIIDNIPLLLPLAVIRVFLSSLPSLAIFLCCFRLQSSEYFYHPYHLWVCVCGRILTCGVDFYNADTWLCWSIPRHNGWVWHN